MIGQGRQGIGRVAAAIIIIAIVLLGGVAASYLTATRTPGASGTASATSAIPSTISNPSIATNTTTVSTSSISTNMTTTSGVVGTPSNTSSAAALSPNQLRVLSISVENASLGDDLKFDVTLANQGQSDIWYTIPGVIQLAPISCLTTVTTSMASSTIVTNTVTATASGTTTVVNSTSTSTACSAPLPIVAMTVNPPSANVGCSTNLIIQGGTVTPRSPSSILYPYCPWGTEYQVVARGTFEATFYIDWGASFQSVTYATEIVKDFSVGGAGGSGTSTIDISTINSYGSAITGYYVTLWQYYSVPLQSCYSPCSFTVNNDQFYQISAASYGSETFGHWQNDGSTWLETVIVPSTNTTISLTAVYFP